MVCYCCCSHLHMAYHIQEMVSKTPNSVLVCTKEPSATAVVAELASRPQEEQEKNPVTDQGGELIKCPRCDSANTKFCYYNNYSLSQPRYLCKSCRRYWTKGGTLRNVPVGGGCRKNSRRAPSSHSSSSSSPLSPSPSAVSNMTVQYQPVTGNYSHHHHDSLLPVLPPHLTYHESTPTTSSPCSAHDLSLALAGIQGQGVIGGSLGFEFNDHGRGSPVVVSNLGNLSNAHFQNILVGSHNKGLGALTSFGVGDFLAHQSLSIHGLGNLYGGTMEIDGGDHDRQIFMGAAVDSYNQDVMITPPPPPADNSASAVPGVKLGEADGRVNIGEDQLSRILWGFPWQINAGGSMGGGAGGWC